MGYYENELIYNIAKKLDLNYFDYQQMISDVNNGRGSEWYEVMREASEKKTKEVKALEAKIKEFKKLVKEYGGT